MHEELPYVLPWKYLWNSIKDHRFLLSLILFSKMGFYLIVSSFAEKYELDASKNLGFVFFRK